MKNVINRMKIIEERRTLENFAKNLSKGLKDFKLGNFEGLKTTTL